MAILTCSGDCRPFDRASVSSFGNKVGSGRHANGVVFIELFLHDGHSEILKWADVRIIVPFSNHSQALLNQRD